ncbi:MAG: FtsX-like permease family protein [Nitrososphaerales archaeon]
MLRRKVFRDIGRSRWQFLAVILIIALGVGLFVALYGSVRNLNASVQHPYDTLKLADLTVSVESAPEEVIDRIKSISGVKEVVGRIVLETSLSTTPINSERITGRIISLPDGEHPSVNDIFVDDGSYLQDDGKQQILVEKAFANHHKVKVGDEVYIETDSGFIELEVAGIAISPEYIWPAKSLIDHMPDVLARWGVIFMSKSRTQELFKMEGEVNEFPILLDDSADLDKTVNEVEHLLQPYGVKETVTQVDQPSYKIIELTVSMVGNLGIIFPVFFLVIASLTTYVLLSRTVHVQAPQIGLMMALGYAKRQILLHYLSFALIAGLIGSTAGTILGYLMAFPITDLFASQINIPFLIIEVSWSAILIGVSLSLVLTGVAGLLPARNAAKLRPAESMRSQPPTSGRVPLLERLIPLGRLSISSKFAIRNIFRNRRRTLFTALGVAFSVSLIMVPLSFLDSIDASTDLFLNKIQKYDAKATFQHPEDTANLTDIRKWNGVSKVETFIEMPTNLKTQRATYRMAVMGLQPQVTLYQVYSSQDKQTTVTEGGILLPKTFAEKAGLKTGDEVELDFKDLSLRYWKNINDTKDEIYEQFRSNITTLHEGLFNLEENITKIHTFLYGLRNNVTQSLFMIYGGPTVYVASWNTILNSSYIAPHPNQPLNIYQVNALANETSWAVITKEFSDNMTRQKPLILAYQNLFYTGWNSTFTEATPSPVSLLSSSLPPLSRAQQVIDNVVPQYFDQLDLPETAKILSTTLYDAFNLTTWNNSTIIDSFVIESAADYIQAFGEEKEFLSKVYSLGSGATKDNFKELALRTILDEIPKNYSSTVIKVFNLGSDASDSDLNRLAENLTDEIVEDIVSDNPPPMKSIRVRIDGLVTNPIESTVYTSLSFAQSVSGLKNSATGVMIDWADDDGDQVSEQLYKSFSVWSIEKIEQAKADWDEMFQLYNAFIGIVLSFGVAIAFAIVFNTVTINILERGREIATMRTLGQSRRRIASMITLEHLIVTAFGLILGMPLGYILSIYFNSLMGTGQMGFTFDMIIFPQTYLITAIGIIAVLILSEIPGLRQVYKLNLAKVTKELVS